MGDWGEQRRGVRKRSSTSAQNRKAHLRADFRWSCAYCGMAEEEARAIRFEVDHYKPRAAGGSNDYENLMWSCELCNRYKGDMYGDPGTTDHHILKVDLEHPADHLEVAEDRSGFVGNSATGEFTVHYLFLANNPRMRRIFEQRQQRDYCDEAIAHGLRVLTEAQLDGLPWRERVAVVRTRDMAKRKLSEIDRLFEELCGSPMPRDLGQSKKRHRERDHYLSSIGVRRTKRTKQRK